MIDVKCKGCNKLLAKADSMNAAIKCPRCHMIFEYRIFSNLFVTNDYDPQKNLHNHKNSGTVTPESTRPPVRSR
jgi:phage FluMu protein Com